MRGVRKCQADLSLYYWYGLSNQWFAVHTVSILYVSFLCETHHRCRTRSISHFSEYLVNVQLIYADFLTHWYHHLMTLFILVVEFSSLLLTIQWIWIMHSYIAVCFNIRYKSEFIQGLLKDHILAISFNFFFR